ncbi:MAG: M48 family metallopeptidase [Mucilaginibacter sp.]|uniref:M48 family metallopeptidase n=1 Tax=Mucilaginibacter sp. TaxID=1882438 RepID=UPI0032679C80
MKHFPKPHILPFVIAVVAFSMSVFIAKGQKNKPVAIPKQYAYTDIESYTVFLNKTVKDDANSFEKKYQKDYLKIISEKNTDLLKDLSERKFLFDSAVYPYLNSVFLHILQKNSLDAGRFHFFVNRTSNVNAYSYEEGTIVCNLGLLNIMENESQVAMVFCHELGHYLLKHVNNSIISQLETYNSSEFLVRVKKIKKQEYNSKKQLEELYKSDVFNRRKHNRSQERAADSLGIALFRNTGYNGTNIAHIFDLLEAAENSPATGVLQSFFKQENMAVADNLFRPSKKMSFSDTRKEETDSLKTHPDCAVRKIAMKNNFDSHGKIGLDYEIANASKFSELKKQALFEEAAFSKENDNLSYYFYQLVQMNTLYPDNYFIKSEIFDTLLSFCIHQKKHQLYAVVSNQYIPDDDKDEYAILLKLIDNIDLGELIAITNKYYTSHKSQINASAEAINNLNHLNN